MIDCDRETDVLELVVAHGEGWRRAASPDLVMHAGSCDVCRDLAEVVVAIRQDQANLVSGAKPPGAGLVWWRANIKAHLEAARTAERPLSLAPGAAAAVIAGAGAAIATGTWPLMPAWHGFSLALLAAGAVVVSPLVLVVAFGRARD